LLLPSLLENGDYFTLDFCLSTGGFCEVGSAHIADYFVYRTAEHHLLIAALQAFDANEAASRSWNKRFPFSHEFPSSQAMTSFLSRMPSLWRIYPQTLHFSFNVCFFVVLANSF
jgi:hypothetical protein